MNLTLSFRILISGYYIILIIGCVCNWCAVASRDVMGPRPYWTLSGPAPFLNVWVLLFETYRIRIGYRSKKQLAGSGPDPSPRVRTRTLIIIKLSYYFMNVVTFV